MEFLESANFADLDAEDWHDLTYLDTPSTNTMSNASWSRMQNTEAHDNGHGAQIDGITLPNFHQPISHILEAGVASVGAPTLDVRPAATMLNGTLTDGMQHNHAEYCSEEQQSEAHDNGHEAQINGFTLPYFHQPASYALAIMEQQERRLQEGIASDVAPTLDDRPTATMLDGALMGGMQHTVAIHQYCDSTPASMLQTPAVPLHAPNNVANKKRARTVASPSATMLADSAGSSTESGEEGGDGRSTPPVMRGSRGQLAYDTQHMDERTKRRLLGNRESAARSQRRKTEHAREVEAALERIAADNSALQARLAAALCFIERLGYPSSLALVPPSSPA